MARFLFVVAPRTGHVNRMRPYAVELERRGHEVAWAAHVGLVGGLLPPGQEVFALPDEPARRALEETRRRTAELTFEPALSMATIDAHALPLARSSLAGVDAAVTRFGPDCVVTDPLALAGPLVARRRGVPWSSSATPGALAAGSLAQLPAARDFAQRRLAPLQREAGVEPVDRPGWSSQLVLVNSVREFLGDLELPPEVRLVGATVDAGRPAVDFPWHLLSDGPVILVSLGTAVDTLGTRFFAALVEALGGEPLQVVVAAAPELVPHPPPNFLVRRFVPQLDLLARLDAVVTHAGHNTVVEALLHGRPLVAAPIAFDQPFNADRLEATGAGVRVRFRRPRSHELREAVRRILDEPGFRRSAERLAAALRAPGGAAAAAAALEGLAAASSVPGGASA